MAWLPRNRRLRLTASALLAASGGAFAAAAPTDGIDLSALHEHVDAMEQTATSKTVQRKCRAMINVLHRRDVPGIGDDLGRLESVRRIAAPLFLQDPDLDDLVFAAMGAADAQLDVPARDALSDVIQDIKKPANRTKVEKLGLRAEAYRKAGHQLLISPRRRDSTVMALFRAAASQFASAKRLAQSLVRRQGGAASRLKTAAPRRVYTVAGDHEGGFNGDYREARRSSLYFVEDTRIGPDGRLYIVDWNNHRVRVRQDDGTLAPFCGSGIPGDSEGPALTMKFNHIGQMRFAPDGRLFIAVWHNHKIKVYDARGAEPILYTIAGSWQGASPTSPGDATPFPATDGKFNLMPGLLLLPPGHPLGGGDLLITDASNCRVMKVGLATSPITATNVAGNVVQTGTCVRFAGTGVPEYTGDGGPADQAGFDFYKFQNAQPDGRMEIDADGNIYVVMAFRHVIRKITPDGKVSTFAGDGTAGWSGDGGPATAAQLNSPGDIAVGTDGRTIFISDTKNAVIRKVAPDGTISTYAGKHGVTGYTGDDGPADQAVFDNPSGIEVDADGNLYVCDRNNHVIRVVTSDAPGAVRLPADPYTLPVSSRGLAPKTGEPGTISTLAGTGSLGFNGDGLPALDCDLYWPQDVSIDPYTKLVYFSDWNNERIRRIEADGTVTTAAGSGTIGDDLGTGTSAPLNHPTDIAFDPLGGDLWIAAWHTDKILRLDGSTQELIYMAGGRRGYGGDDGLATAAKLNLPSSVKFDAAGNWFIADEANRRIRYVDRASGVITTLAGTGEPTDGTHPLGDGGPALQATFNFPVGQDAQPAGRICLDPTERFLYVADTDNHRIRRIDLQTKIITTFAGTGTPTPLADSRGDGGPAVQASFYSPTDVDCDAAGNVFVADRENNAVRRIDLATGIVTTYAGGNGRGYSGDGGPAELAKLKSPAGIHVDRATGRVYIADTLNAMLRVVW